MRHTWGSTKRAGGLVAAAIVIVLLLGGTLRAQVNTWVTKAPMPAGRQAVAAGVIDGVLYVVGGVDLNGFLTGVEAYDPKTDTWTTKAALPGPRCCMAAGVVDGMLYVVGGHTSAGAANALATVEAYDPTTNAWTRKADIPTPRTDAAAAVVDGLLYVMGGNLNAHFQAPTSTVEAYDPKSNTWSRKADMPTAQTNLAAAAVNGLIFAVGGISPDSPRNDIVEAYDPKTNTWTTRAPLPTPRYNLAAASVDGVLYAAGGDQGGPELTRAVSTVEAYDAITNTWSSAPPMPTPRFGLGLAAIENTLYAVGGLRVAGDGSNVPLAVNEAFSPFLAVTIDIKPGDPNNTINLNSRATIQVAILSAAELDALTVDPASLTLTPAGGQASARPAAVGASVVTTGRGTPITVLRDLDRDGRLDLVVHFRIEDLQLSPGDTEAVLRGATFSGQRIRGADAIRVLDGPFRPLGQTDARGRQRR